MKQTRLKLPRRFLAEIGFIDACQRPFGRALPKIRHSFGASFNSRLEAIEKKLTTYEPARWVGYYADRRVNRGMVHDGLFHIPVPLEGAFVAMLEELRRTSFAELEGALPVEGGIILTMPEPPHILLHDTLNETTFVEPFEAGILFLWKSRASIVAALQAPANAGPALGRKS